MQSPYKSNDLDANCRQRLHDHKITQTTSNDLKMRTLPLHAHQIRRAN